MPSRDSTLEEIKNRIDIVDLISEYVLLKRSGQNWRGLCPFHSEKTPSFTVSPSKQIFHCFGCGVGGDVFTFLEKYENMTFQEALEFLARRAGIEIKKYKKDSASTARRQIMLEIHRRALEFFNKSLNENKQALSYLKDRGISEQAIKHFSLGYAPQSWDALTRYLESKGYSTEQIMSSGLVSRGQKGMYDTFRNRIIFPIFDLKGEVVAFGGRSIDGSEPKYLNSPETLIFNKSRVLYGLSHAKDAIRGKGYILLMEGYMDVITSHMNGFQNAIAPLGTAFTQDHARLIRRFTERVIISFDSDEAGVKAAKRSAIILLQEGLKVDILLIPRSEDPDSYLRNRGKEAFGDLIDRSVSILEFILSQSLERDTLAHEALEIISAVQDKVLQGEYVKMLSERLGINEYFIIEELKKKRHRFTERQRAETPHTSEKPSTRPLNEVYLIKLMLQMPEKIPDISGMIDETFLTDEVVRGIFKNMKEGFDDINDLMFRCNEREKTLLSEISLQPEISDPDRVLNDCLKRIKEAHKKAMIRDYSSRIREAESKGDYELVKRLQMELNAIVRSS